MRDRNILLLSIVLLLTACSDRTDKPVQVSPSQNVPQVKPETGIPKAAQTAEQILEAFRNDLKACHGVVRYRQEPPARTQVNLQEPERILDIAPYAGTPEVTYIKANGDYVYVSLSFHPDPFTVSRFKETDPFYCGVTARRLDDIEKLGASDEGWEIWAYFLNLAIDHLEPLMDIGPGGDSILWGWAQQKFERAEALYAQTQREKLFVIAQRAASKIEASRAEGYETLAQLNKAETQTNAALTPKSEIDDAFKERHAFIQGLMTRLQKRPQ